MTPSTLNYKKKKKKIDIKKIVSDSINIFFFDIVCTRISFSVPRCVLFSFPRQRPMKEVERFSVFYRKKPSDVTIYFKDSPGVPLWYNVLSLVTSRHYILTGGLIWMRSAE